MIVVLRIAFLNVVYWHELSERGNSAIGTSVPVEL